MTQDNQDNTFEHLDPPSDSTQLMQQTTSTNFMQLSPMILPQAVQTAAESSISLRQAQNKLIELLITPDYLSIMGAAAPETLPQLVDALTNAINVSDNLFIKTAQTAEKSATTNRILEYLTRQLDSAAQKQQQSEQIPHDATYDKTIDNIKQAIYARLNEERDAEGTANAELFKDPDIIEAEHTEVQDNE